MIDVNKLINNRKNNAWITIGHNRGTTRRTLIKKRTNRFRFYDPQKLWHDDLIIHVDLIEPKIEDIVLDTLIIECKDNEWYS